MTNGNQAGRTGGQILVAQLERHGVTEVFGVPGESYLAVLDALYDSDITFVTCRNEAGAAMMAEAAGKLSGSAGVCFVTRGPGASNACPGLHVAHQDSTPVVMFVGQVERANLGRDTFQELDYKAVFGSIAKWVVEIDDAARVPELVARAFRVAQSGRPGPVVVALPEDMLLDVRDVQDALNLPPQEVMPSDDDLGRFIELLSEAKRPVAILGGTRWSAEATEQFAAFAERLRIPVYCSFRRQMLFRGEHECYGGDLGLGCNPAILSEVGESDLILLVGGRFSEVPSQGYTLIKGPVPTTPVVHVHPGVDEVGRVFTPELALPVSPVAFCRALAKLDLSKVAPASDDRIRCIHENYLSWSNAATVIVPGSFQIGQMVEALRELLPEDAILCNGAGNYAVWIHRFWRYRGYGTQLAPVSGSMGYGIPAAVAAKYLRPRQMVVAFAGDGCFLMNGQEFSTAVQAKLQIIVVVIDNGMYGTIRMHQERDYPGRVSGTELSNPDFAAYARAFGGHGETVNTVEEFVPAFERAATSGKPAILHCRLDPEALTPSRSLTQIREAALASQ